VEEAITSSGTLGVQVVVRSPGVIVGRVSSALGGERHAGTVTLSFLSLNCLIKNRRLTLIATVSSE
jgi:hypothetical protein